MSYKFDIILGKKLYYPMNSNKFHFLLLFIKKLMNHLNRFKKYYAISIIKNE